MSVAHPNELIVSVSEAGKGYVIGEPIALAGMFINKPAGKLRVAVHSPSGWNKEIQTNANGIAEFTPLWPGRYYIEASKTDKMAGEQDGKPYQAVWRCATYVIDVAEK